MALLSARFYSADEAERAATALRGSHGVYTVSIVSRNDMRGIPSLTNYSLDRTPYSEGSYPYMAYETMLESAMYPNFSAMGLSELSMRRDTMLFVECRTDNGNENGNENDVRKKLVNLHAGEIRLHNL